MALAAYHGGVVEAAESAGLATAAVAGASAGAVTCAILAGNGPSRRLATLKAFWHLTEHESASRRTSSASAWASVFVRRLFGEQGQFEPRTPIANLARFRSVYARSNESTP